MALIDVFRPSLLGLAALALVGCQPAAPDGETPPAVAEGDAGAGVSETETPDVSSPPPAEDQADIDLPPLGAPAIWTLADEDTTIHFFGTVHILKPDVEWRTAELDATLAAADALYLEADVTSPEAQATMARLVPQLGVFTDGSKLTDFLTEDEAREVRETAEIIGLPMAALEPMKPWLATVQMSYLSLQQQGYEEGKGVEMVLKALAAEDDIPLRFLETGEQQLNFFADLDIEDQVDFLVASAIQIEEEPGMLDQLVAEWAEGDIDDLAHMLAEPDAMGSEAVYDVLIVERNRAWAEAVADLLEAEAGTFLFAVGAAHLAGEDSVVEMLRADGFEISGP